MRPVWAPVGLSQLADLRLHLAELDQLLGRSGRQGEQGVGDVDQRREATGLDSWRRSQLLASDSERSEGEPEGP